MTDIKKGEGITKLTWTGDFDIWQFKMRLHLRSVGVYNIVKGMDIEPPYPSERDRLATRDWREYQTKKDMAVAIMIQGLTDELAMLYREEK